MNETNELTANISHWLNIAGQKESLKEETDATWESWVARPCIQTALAPRQARAALEVIGHLANYGYSVEKILYALVNIPRFKAIFYQKAPQAPSQSKPPGSGPVASATESI